MKCARVLAVAATMVSIGDALGATLAGAFVHRLQAAEPSSSVALAEPDRRDRVQADLDHYLAVAKAKVIQAEVLGAKLLEQLKPGDRAEVEAPVDADLIALQQALLDLEVEQSHVERVLNRIEIAGPETWMEQKRSADEALARLRAAARHAEAALRRYGNR